MSGKNWGQMVILLFLLGTGGYAFHTYQQYQKQQDQIIWDITVDKAEKFLDNPKAQIGSYREYLIQYPEGQYAEKARLEIEKLLTVQRAEMMWQNLVAKASQKDAPYASQINDYEEYLAEYPQGKYSSLATEKIKKLRAMWEAEEKQKRAKEEADKQKRDALAAEEAFWQGILQKIQKAQEMEEQIAAYQLYKEKYPQGKYVARCRMETAKLERNIAEHNAFQQALDPDKELPERIHNLEQFLLQYPEGRHAREAEKSLRDFQNEHTADNILKLSPSQWKESKDLKSADQKLLDLLELVQDSWNSGDRDRARKQIETAQSMVAEESPVRAALTTLHESLYRQQIEYYFSKDGAYPQQLELLCREAVQYFPRVDQFKTWYEKAKEENIPVALRSTYRKGQEHQKQGRYEEALKIYQSILPKMNEHYQKLVLSSMDDVKNALSEREYNKGFQQEQEGKLEAALEQYQAAFPSMTEKYKNLCIERQKICKQKLFAQYYDLAKEAYRNKDNAQCLEAILKAERLEKDDVYLKSLKLQVIDKVYNAYEERILKYLQEQRIDIVREILLEIEKKYHIDRTSENLFSQYHHFLDAYDQAREKFRVGDYKECIEWCQKALKYQENTNLRTILAEAEMEKGKYNVHLLHAQEYIATGKVVQAQEELARVRALRGDIPEIKRMEKKWFLQLAQKEKSAFIEALLYKVPGSEGEWILDMSCPTWCSLPQERQVALASAYQKAYAAQRDLPVEKVFRLASLSLTMVFVPPARYWRGSPPSEEGRYMDEARHLVVVSQPFWISKYETTQEQWAVVTLEKPWEGQKYTSMSRLGKEDKASTYQNPNAAVSYVSWKDIVSKFLPKLEEKFSLLTEAQWEYACRAGTLTRFYWGEDPNLEQIENYAWYAENAEKKGESYAHNVGEKKPNAWGIHDMSGNVYEWCSDWMGEYPIQEQIDPVGPSVGEQKVYRGGMWLHKDAYCRSASRTSYAPDYRGHYTGFRVMKEIIDEKVVLVSMSWAGSTAIENVMKYVIEEKLGLQVEIRQVAEADIWPELERGTVDIFPDLWIPNRIAPFQEYVENKKTVLAKVSYPDAGQGFYIPAKIAKQYGIKTISDLQGKESLFDVTGDGRGDIWIGEPSWDSTQINLSKIKEYNLQLDPLTIEEKTFFKLLIDTMQTENPILFYFWEPGWITSVYDMKPLEEPAYTSSKWILNLGKPESTHISCAYPKATIYVGISKKLQKRLPKVHKFLMNWYIPINHVSFLIAEITDIPGRSAKKPADAVKEWIQKNPEILKDWLRDG